MIDRMMPGFRTDDIQDRQATGTMMKDDER